MLSIPHAPDSFKDALTVDPKSGKVLARSMPAKTPPNTGPRLTILTSRAANQGIRADYYEALSTRLTFAAVSALPQLKSKTEATASAGTWSITLRPVKATKQSCVGCHGGIKQGDTLGVLIYAVN